MNKTEETIIQPQQDLTTPTTIPPQQQLPLLLWKYSTKAVQLFQDFFNQFPHVISAIEEGVTSPINHVYVFCHLLSMCY